MDPVSFQENVCLLVCALTISTVTGALRMIGGNMTVVQGGTVILPCKVTGTSKTVSQITWHRKTRGKPQKDNFLTISQECVSGKDQRFKFIGDLSDGNGSLQFSAVTLMDEGTYTCIFALFPSGNHQTEIPLNLKVPPVISLKVNHPTEGNENVSLATCTAAGSKPPAEVRWLNDTLPGKVTATTSSTLHANGTTTTVSSLFGVPTREMNGHLVQCVISSAALAKEEILTSTIQIHRSITTTERTVPEEPGGVSPWWCFLLLPVIFVPLGYLFRYIVIQKMKMTGGVTGSLSEPKYCMQIRTTRSVTFSCQESEYTVTSCEVPKQP